MKYSGLLILFIAIGGILANWQFAQSSGQGPSGNTSDSNIAGLLQQVKISPQALADLKSTLVQTQRLRQMNQTPDGGSAPQLIDLQPVNPPKVESPTFIDRVVAKVMPTQKKRSRPLRRYKLSMAFVGPGSRYAVIDGQFTHEGDQLPGGGIVMAIQEGKVKVRQQGVVQTLSVAGVTN